MQKVRAWIGSPTYFFVGALGDVPAMLGHSRAWAVFGGVVCGFLLGMGATPLLGEEWMRWVNRGQRGASTAQSLETWNGKPIATVERDITLVYTPVRSGKADAVAPTGETMTGELICWWGPYYSDMSEFNADRHEPPWMLEDEQGVWHAIDGWRVSAAATTDALT